MNGRRYGFAQAVQGFNSRETRGTSLQLFKQELIGHRIAFSQSLMKKDLRGHFGCVNAIEFSSDGQFIASGGDDRRLLLWNIGQAMVADKSPDVIDTLHVSNINSCCFDCRDEKIATGGNDGQVIIHDFNVHQSTAVYGLSDAVYCLSADPQNATILATANDEGKAQIIDTRLSPDSVPFVLADLDFAMHSVMYNPVDPRLLVTANSKHGVALWDIRMPLKALNYKSIIQNCMSVRFNRLGDKILVLRRRAGPVLYDVGKPNPIYEFDYLTYYNACTLKSCSFAGLCDEYVMSGSDDFCIYLWKVPTDPSENYIQCQPHMILKGHRSIVNQVRYCPQNQVIISSGVEKLIKLWSPYSLPGCSGHLVHKRRYGDDDELERDAYSHEEYIHMVLQAGSFLSHDYSNGTVEEEPCMIAFFDSLIQREIEQTVDENDDEDEDNSNNIGSTADEENKNDAQSSHGNSDDDDDEDDDGGGDDEDDGGGGGIIGVRNLKQSSSDAPLCQCTSARSPTPTAVPPEAAADSETEDSSTRGRIGIGSRRSEESSRPFYLDLDSSSSGSDTEVEDILGAMYRRYMSAREQAASSVNRPAGKKISSVIARGKQRESKSIVARKAGRVPEEGKKKKNCPCRLQRIREDLQHSGDQFLRDNATSMSMLADVIDSFIDNLVPDDSGNSRTLSDTNDGHMSTDSGTNGGMLEDLAMVSASTSSVNSDHRSSLTSSTSASTLSSFSKAHSTGASTSKSCSTSNLQISNGSGRSSAPVSSSPPSIGPRKVSHSSNRNLAQLITSPSSTSGQPSSLSVAERGMSIPSIDHQLTQGNESIGVERNGKSKTYSSQKTQIRDPTQLRTSVIGNGANSSSPISLFQLEKSRLSSSDPLLSVPQNGTNTLCSATANGASAVAESLTNINIKDGSEVKFIAPEKKSLNYLPKRPSLLSTTSHTSTISNSSSSSSLSSDFNGVSENSQYFASSSSADTDFSNEISVDPEAPRVFGSQTASSGSANVVHFKKAKIRGRHFRSRKVDSDSSSEEDR